MSARVRPTKAQWGMTDEDVSARRAAVETQLEQLRPPTGEEVEAALARSPPPEDGFVMSADRARHLVFCRLLHAQKRLQGRLCKELSQLEHVASYRAVQPFNDAPSEPEADDPPTNHEPERQRTEAEMTETMNGIEPDEIDPPEEDEEDGIESKDSAQGDFVGLTDNMKPPVIALTEALREKCQKQAAILSAVFGDAKDLDTNHKNVEEHVAKLLAATATAKVRHRKNLCDLVGGWREEIKAEFGKGAVGPWQSQLVIDCQLGRSGKSIFKRILDDYSAPAERWAIAFKNAEEGECNLDATLHPRKLKAKPEVKEEGATDRGGAGGETGDDDEKEKKSSILWEHIEERDAEEAAEDMAEEVEAYLEGKWLVTVSMDVAEDIVDALGVRSLPEAAAKLEELEAQGALAVEEDAPPAELGEDEFDATISDEGNVSICFGERTDAEVEKAAHKIMSFVA
jgi:hypothetical protein